MNKESFYYILEQLAQQSCHFGWHYTPHDLGAKGFLNLKNGPPIGKFHAGEVDDLTTIFWLALQT